MISKEKRERIHELHRLDQGRCALLVIDMQRGFVDAGASLEVPAAQAIVPNISALIDACRARQLPVIYTEFVYSATIPCLRGDPFGIEHLPSVAGKTGFGLPSSNCLIGPGRGEGVESSRTISSLQPREGELVIEAHTYDKFYGTHLDLALRSFEIDRLLLTGVTTDVCVNATLMSAATRNYRVTAITDGVATIHEHIQRACFEIWENKFARLATTGSAIDELSQRS